MSSMLHTSSLLNLEAPKQDPCSVESNHERKPSWIKISDNCFPTLLHTFDSIDKSCLTRLFRPRSGWLATESVCARLETRYFTCVWVGTILWGVTSSWMIIRFVDDPLVQFFKTSRYIPISVKYCAIESQLFIFYRFVFSRVSRWKSFWWLVGLMWMLSMIIELHRCTWSSIVNLTIRV